MTETPPLELVKLKLEQQGYTLKQESEFVYTLTDTVTGEYRGIYRPDAATLIAVAATLGHYRRDYEERMNAVPGPDEWWTTGGPHRA